MSSGAKECGCGVFNCSCAMAQHWPAPASKVPWVVREPSNQELKDSRFFKEVLCSKDQQKSDTNQRLYLLINDTFFPFYLPERYHSMDCVAIKNNTKVEGYYWTHASYFLLSNQLHGLHFWKSTAHLASNPSLTELLHLLPFLTRKKKSEMFQDGLELCKTSAEFLLNPWVLMQLPWNPVLLLQWTAAYLTEYYSLHSEMIEFYRWHLPLMPSRVFAKLLDLIARMNFFAFWALFHIMVHDVNRSKAHSYERAGPYLTMLIHEVVPVLEFVTSGKARNIVRSLKRLSFGSNFNMTNARNPKDFQSHNYEWEDTYTCMFSSHFWSRGDYDKVIGTILMGSTDDQAINSGRIVDLSGSEEFREIATPQWIAQMETKYGKKFDPRKILSLLEPMISQGAITNISNEDLLKGIEFFETYFTHCYYRLMELKAIIDGGLRDEDAGVLYDVIYMRTKYRIADVQCAMLQKLAHFCYAFVTRSVTLNALNAQGPKMSLSQISKMIQEAAEKKRKIKKTSCWKELKKRLPLNSKSKVNLYEECPNLAVEGALKVAEKFEDRIKRMVLNVLEDHETWTENEIKIHPEQQIVQYILPCFVASMLEFVGNDDVELKYKQNYVRIVHKLIKDFEVHPYKVPCMDGSFAGGFSPYYMVDICFHKSVASWQVELLGRGLQAALGPSRKSSIVCEILDKNFFSVLLDFENTRLRGKNHPPDYTMQRMLWRIQVHNLFGRMLRAIEAAVPGSFPNLMALEMSMIANICFADHANKYVDPATVIDPVLDPIFEQLCLVTKFLAWRNIGTKSQLLLESVKDPDFQQCIIWKECLKLSLEQITALIVFYSVQRLEGKGTHEKHGEFRVPMDRAEEVYFAYHAGDQVKLKLLLGKMFTRSGINFSEVTYEFAKKSAPLVYLIALAKVYDNRVLMKEPCELSLIPFKHCRWCGLVQNDVLRLCEECKADRRFPYRTWFCSDECQRQAMDKVHREEHVRHLLLSIGIEDGKAREELKTEAKKKKKRSNKCTCPHEDDDL